MITLGKAAIDLRQLEPADRLPGGQQDKLDDDQLPAHRGGRWRRPLPQAQPVLVDRRRRRRQIEEAASSSSASSSTILEAGKILGVERGIPCSAAVRDALAPTLDAQSQIALNFVVQPRRPARPAAAVPAGRRRRNRPVAARRTQPRKSPSAQRTPEDAGRSSSRKPPTSSPAPAADAYDRALARAAEAVARLERAAGPSFWSRAWQNHAPGYLFLLPWFIGFFGLTIGPILTSLYLSFTDFDLLTAARLGRRRQLRPHVHRRPANSSPSMRVTLFFVLFSVPLKLAFALGVAMLLNRGMRGPAALPRHVLPALAARRLGRHRGAVAHAVRRRRRWSTTSSPIFGIKGPSWISNPRYLAVDADPARASGSSARR